MSKAGRKPKDGVTRETRITIKISEEEYKRLLNISEYVDLPKSVSARNMLLFGLKEVEEMKKAGSLQSAKGLLKTSDFLQKIATTRFGDKERSVHIKIGSKYKYEPLNPRVKKNRGRIGVLEKYFEFSEFEGLDEYHMGQAKIKWDDTKRIAKVDMSELVLVEEN